MNTVIITGRATADCELKQTTSGTFVTAFSVAVKRAFKNANGEHESDFFACVAYNKTAEIIGKYVKKGDLIGIIGRLQKRNYTSKDERKIYVVEIIVENVEFFQSKKKETPQHEPSYMETTASARFEEVDSFEDLPF